MTLRRPPRPGLRPFVELLWAADECREPRAIVTRREHVLPTGAMHLVFRLSDDPLRLFDDIDDRIGRTIGTTVVGGARTSFYIREVSAPLCSVGAQLRPGAAQALFGVPADALAERHTRLDDLWSGPVASMRDQLAACVSLEARLDLFEGMLASRLPVVRGVHPAVALALEQFSMTSRRVGEVVRDTGYSHRTFISLFARAVGVAPKDYCRVLRFRRALPRLFAGQGAQVDLAAEAGYCDQAHFAREFRAFAGLTPGEYARALPRSPHHVSAPPRA
jgi:AraC-like DNA-binding protein